jgi:hypothetical protein
VIVTDFTNRLECVNVWPLEESLREITKALEFGLG